MDAEARHSASHTATPRHIRGVCRRLGLRWLHSPEHCFGESPAMGVAAIRVVPGTGSYPVALRVRLPPSRPFANARYPSICKGSRPLSQRQNALMDAVWTQSRSYEPGRGRPKRHPHRRQTGPRRRRASSLLGRARAFAGPPSRLLPMRSRATPRCASDRAPSSAAGRHGECTHEPRTRCAERTWPLHVFIAVTEQQSARLLALGELAKRLSEEVGITDRA